MQKRRNIIPIFFIFLIISICIFFFFSKSIAGILEHVTVPIQKAAFISFHKTRENKTEGEKLKEENSRLLVELAKQKEIEKENKALHDQFNSPKVSPRKLLPVQIVGTGNDEIIVDRGSNEGVKKDNIVIVKNTLVGRVSKTSAHISVIHLTTHTGVSFTAETQKTGALGVAKGRGGAIIMDNVVLSDKLEKNDTVVTRGDIDNTGKGYPPGLIVGKITSVNKRASNLFQLAEVKSVVDLSRLNTVFIMTE